MQSSSAFRDYQRLDRDSGPGYGAFNQADSITTRPVIL
jgi:hypothetical protein